MVSRLAVLLLLLSVPAVAAAEEVAEGADCERFAPDVADEAGSPELAAQLAESAEDARDAGCYKQADRLFEGAHYLLPRARYIYERVLLQEVLGEYQFAFDLLDGYRQEMLADPSITDLAQVDMRLRAALHPKSNNNTTPEVPPEIEPIPTPPRSTVNTVGPIAVGALGAVSLGFAVYGLTAKCHETNSGGDCIEGNTVKVGPTTAFAVGGVLGVVGGAVWWIVTTPRAKETARIRPTANGISFLF